jgi:alpha-tubulin suppressor-like RCC1 family protein
MQGAEEKM